MKLLGFCALATLLVTAPNAIASSPEPDSLEQSPEIFLPNSAPRGDVVVHENDVVLRLPILWASAARIDQAVTLSVFGKSRELAAGTLLPEVKAIASDQPGGIIHGFCTPPGHGERAMDHGVYRVLFSGLVTGAIARQVAKNGSSGQFCLFDTTGGGHLDQIRYYDSAHPVGSPPEKMSPLPFTKLAMTRVSPADQDEVRVTATHLGRHTLTLTLDIVQAGQARVFTSITASGVTEQKHFDIDLDKSFPQTLHYFGIYFKVVSFNIKYKTVNMIFPQDDNLNKFEVIPEDTRYCYGYRCP